MTSAGTRGQEWKISLHCWIKLERFKKTEEANYGRKSNFVTDFCGSACDSVLAPKHTILSDEALFHWSVYISAQNKRYCRSMRPKQISEAPIATPTAGPICFDQTKKCGP
jgi:hypothetical protein